jgi:hypothetical protein
MRIGACTDVKCIREPKSAFNAQKAPDHPYVAAESLAEAQRVARLRKVSVSAVISESLSEGLRLQSSREQSDEVLERYKQAFDAFTDEEMLLLDGIVFEPAARGVSR